MNDQSFLEFDSNAPSPSSPQGHSGLRHRAQTAPELPLYKPRDPDAPPLPPRPPLPPALMPGAPRLAHNNFWSDLSFQQQHPNPHREWSLPDPLWKSTAPSSGPPPPRPQPPIPPPRPAIAPLPVPPIAPAVPINNPERSPALPPKPIVHPYYDSSSSSRSDSPHRGQGRSPNSNSPVTEHSLSTPGRSENPSPTSPPTPIAPLQPEFLAGSSKQQQAPMLSRISTSSSSSSSGLQISTEATSLTSPIDKDMAEALRRSLLPADQLSPIRTTGDEDVRLAMQLSSLDDERALAESRLRAERERLDMEFARRLQMELENAPPTPADNPPMANVLQESLSPRTPVPMATPIARTTTFSPPMPNPPMPNPTVQAPMPPTYEQAIHRRSNNSNTLPMKVTPLGGGLVGPPAAPIAAPPVGPHSFYPPSNNSTSPPNPTHSQSRPPVTVPHARSDPEGLALRRVHSSEPVTRGFLPQKQQHPHMVRSQTAQARPSTSSGGAPPPQGSFPPVPRLPPHITTTGLEPGSSKPAAPPKTPPQARAEAIPGGPGWRTTRVDPELLKGLSIGFTPPPTISDSKPMTGIIPDVIHLPAAPSPPFHIQARSWRSLLRLLATLDSTRLEASVEALAVLKEEARLRTVIQFNKVDYSQSDWRVVIYLTLDHALPPSARGVHKYTNGDTTTLPYSYTLCKPPVRMQNGDTSQFFTVPQTATSPLPTLPLGISNLALYLQSVLEDSRRVMNDVSGGSRRLAKMVETYYPGEMRATAPEEEGSREGSTMKRLFGGWRKPKDRGRGANEETYDLVTPFRLDDY